MGLTDTDFIQEKREDERQYRRGSNSREWSATSMVAFIFLVLVLGAAGYLAWAVGHQIATRAATTASPTLPTKSTEPQAFVLPAPARLPMVRGSANTVFKCETEAATTYVASPSDCPKQARVSGVSIDPDQNLSDGLADAAQIIRQPSPNAQTTAADSPSNLDPNVQRKLTCEAYEQEINTIDARARQPLSGQEQDWLAAKRHKVRDAQFRLHC